MKKIRFTTDTFRPAYPFPSRANSESVQGKRCGPLIVHTGIGTGGYAVSLFGSGIAILTGMDSEASARKLVGILLREEPDSARWKSIMIKITSNGAKAAPPDWLEPIMQTAVREMGMEWTGR